MKFLAAAARSSGKVNALVEGGSTSAGFGEPGATRTSFDASFPSEKAGDAEKTDVGARGTTAEEAGRSGAISLEPATSVVGVAVGVAAVPHADDDDAVSLLVRGRGPSRSIRDGHRLTRRDRRLRGRARDEDRGRDARERRRARTKRPRLEVALRTSRLRGASRRLRVRAREETAPRRAGRDAASRGDSTRADRREGRARVGYSARHHRERGEADGADARCCLASRSARIWPLRPRCRGKKRESRKGDFSCFLFSRFGLRRGAREVDPRRKISAERGRNIQTAHTCEENRIPHGFRQPDTIWRTGNSRIQILACCRLVACPFFCPRARRRARGGARLRGTSTRAAHAEAHRGQGPRARVGLIPVPSPSSPAAGVPTRARRRPNPEISRGLRFGGKRDVGAFRLASTRGTERGTSVPRRGHRFRETHVNVRRAREDTRDATARDRD